MSVSVSIFQNRKKFPFVFSSTEFKSFYHPNIIQRKVQINNQHSIMFAEMQKRFSGAFIFNDLLDAFVSICRFIIDRRYSLIYSSFDSIL